MQKLQRENQQLRKEAQQWKEIAGRHIISSMEGLSRVLFKSVIMLVKLGMNDGRPLPEFIRSCEDGDYTYNGEGEESVPTSHGIMGRDDAAGVILQVCLSKGVLEEILPEALPLYHAISGDAHWCATDELRQAHADFDKLMDAVGPAGQVPGVDPARLTRAMWCRVVGERILNEAFTTEATERSYDGGP